MELELDVYTVHLSYIFTNAAKFYAASRFTNNGVGHWRVIIRGGRLVSNCVGNIVESRLQSVSLIAVDVTVILLLYTVSFGVYEIKYVYYHLCVSFHS